MTRKYIKIIGLIVLIFIFCSSLNISKASKFNMAYLYGNFDYTVLVNRTNGGLNEVSPSYFDLNNDGSLLLNTVDSTFVEEMHKQGVKVVPFLSNHWDREKGRNALANAATLANQIANAIVTYNLDGVNVDIENVTDVDKAAYTNFVKTLREKLSNDKSVSVAVAANPNSWTIGWHGSYDYAELAKYADYLMIMTYDEHWQGGEAGPIASIDFVEKSIKYALKYVPKEKIVLGIPFFGRYWQSGVSYGGYGLSLTKINQLINNYENNITYNKASESPMVLVTINAADVKPIVNGRTLYAGTYEIWYENEESIKAKLDLVNKYDLKGAGSWSLGQEGAEVWSYYNQALNGGTFINKIFPDVENDRWSYENIKKVKESNLMNGKTNGMFEPDSNLTRAEFATVIARLLDVSDNGRKISYTDTINHWAKNDIEAVTKTGLMNGYENGEFRPDNSITREEVAKVISLLEINSNNNENILYNDVSDNMWSYEYVLDVTRKGLMNGYENDTFRPQKTITREEIATVLSRILDYN